MPAPKLDNEQMLLRLMSAGNEDAFAKIFRFYAPSLAGYVMSVVGSRETAEEIIQDVFLKVWQRREHLNSINNFQSYLFIMTRNATMREISKIAAEIKKLQSYRKWVAYTGDQPAKAENADYLPLIDQAVEQLPSQQQQVYQLAKSQGMSYKDIGHHMQIHPSTVKRYMYIATQTISRFVKSHARRSFIFFIAVLFY